MIFRLKDGRLMSPVQIGYPDHQGANNKIKGINIEVNDKDLFGRPVIEDFLISDIDCFFGAYSFSPADYLKERAVENRNKDYSEMKTAKVGEFDEQD